MHNVGYINLNNKNYQKNKIKIKCYAQTSMMPWSYLTTCNIVIKYKIIKNYFFGLKNLYGRCKSLLISERKGHDLEMEHASSNIICGLKWWNSCEFERWLIKLIKLDFDQTFWFEKWESTIEVWCIKKSNNNFYYLSNKCVTCDVRLYTYEPIIF